MALRVGKKVDMDFKHDTWGSPTMHIFRPTIILLYSGRILKVLFVNKMAINTKIY